MRWWLALSQFLSIHIQNKLDAMQLYTRTHTHTHYTVPTHSLSFFVCVWKEIETKIYKMGNKVGKIVQFKRFSSHSKWKNFWSCGDSQTRCTHTHSKNYDYKFLVCSNLMSTFLFGRFFRKHFKYKVKRESEKYASSTRRKTTIVKLFPFTTSFSSHLF